MIYFWVDDKVVEYEGSRYCSDMLDSPYVDHYCVDDTLDDIADEGRYGKYTLVSDIDEFEPYDVYIQWIPIPKKDFPPEFRMNLMLLGIT